MGKHDMKPATSGEEFLQNKIRKLEKENKELRDKLVYAAKTIKKLQEQCGKMSKWANEIEANYQDEVKKWKGKALSLVDDYVGRE